MGKIPNYRAIHNNYRYEYAWVHTPTDDRLAVEARSAIRPEWNTGYAITRLREHDTTPFVILSLVMAKDKAREIAVEIARKNPTGLFNSLNLPKWGHGHHIELTLGYIDIHEKYVDPDMGNPYLEERLRDHPKTED